MADEFEVSSLNSSEIDSPIPSVVERLGQLRPSKELLEYYRRKLVEYDGEQEQLVSKLEEYKSTYEEQVFFSNIIFNLLLFQINLYLMLIFFVYLESI